MSFRIFRVLLTCFFRCTVIVLPCIHIHSRNLYNVVEIRKITHAALGACLLPL